MKFSLMKKLKLIILGLLDESHIIKSLIKINLSFHQIQRKEFSLDLVKLWIMKITKSIMLEKLYKKMSQQILSI